MTMPARDLITATRAGVRGSALNRFGKSAEISSASSKRNGHHDRSTTPPLETLLRARAESPRLTTPVSMPSLRRALVIASAFALALVAFSCVAVVRSPRELVDAGTSVQVIMDVSGVIITCTVASFIFANADKIPGLVAF